MKIQLHFLFIFRLFKLYCLITLAYVSQIIWIKNGDHVHTFLFLDFRFQFLSIYYEVVCWFVIDDFYYIEKKNIVFQFSVNFFHEWVSNKMLFLYILKWFFLLRSVNVVHYMGWFAHVETFLYWWCESFLFQL